MTVTLLSQAPNVSSLKTRHIQKETSLVITPPLAGHEGPIEGEIYICEEQDQASLYCQLDVGLFFPNQVLPEDEYEREETMTELYLIPRDSGAVEGIFAAMSDCAALHPDKEFMEEQESDDEFYGGEELTQEQQTALDRLDSLIVPTENGHYDDPVDESQ
ncbi:hypothetical protein G6F56_013282 [Rhizopus delemar]|nr:hypothetical protein G6F56_013282 [Rhizopus delemar]